MTTSFWSSGQIDLLKISASPYSGQVLEDSHTQGGGDGWVAGGPGNASGDTYRPQGVEFKNDGTGFMDSAIGGYAKDGLSGESFAAPETPDFPPMANIGVMATPAVAAPNTDMQLEK